MIGSDAYDGWGWRITAGIALLLVLAVGFGLRVYLAVQAFASTFDTSTPALMALHILKGERPLFFYGQNYMGAPEVYLTAFIMYLTKPSLLAVTMGPIVATLGWIAATYGLFRDLCDWRVGIAAALCVAVPGWDTLWYSVGSYGGYPTAFFCGTLSLWLLVRLSSGELTPLAETMHLLVLGLVAGLGMWSHYLTAIYLITGGCLFLVFVIRERFRRDLLVKCGAAALLFLVAFSPSIMAFEQYGGGHVIKMELSPAVVVQNFRIFERRCLPRLLFWPMQIPGWGKAAIVVVLCLGAVLYLVALLTTRDRTLFGRMLIPPLFCVLFFAIYLPHEMAKVGAPRYVIPMACMALATVFALPLATARRRISWTTVILLGLWLAYNAACAVVVADKHAPRKQVEIERRNRLVEHARATGAHTVTMVGGPIFGHEGQTLSFYARDKIAFVSDLDERYQPAAQAAETALPQVLAVEAPIAPKVASALDALQVRYQVTDDPWVCLFSNLEVPDTSRRSIPAEEMHVALGEGVQGEGEALLDRVFETWVSGACVPEASITVDLGRVRQIEGIWLTAPGFYQLELPEGYRISTSMDGENFSVLSDVARRIPVSYINGGIIYFKGYFGRMECRFDPVPARYLRMEATAPQRKVHGRWKLNELLVFEPGEASPDQQVDTAAMARWLDENGVSFAFADRWLSAKLLMHWPPTRKHYRVFPRFNPKYTFTHLSREVHPQAGLAIVPLREVADDCVSVLREVFGDAVIAQRREFGQYTALLLDEGTRITKEDARVLWNGHLLVKSHEREGLWY